MHSFWLTILIHLLLVFLFLDPISEPFEYLRGVFFLLVAISQCLGHGGLKTGAALTCVLSKLFVFVFAPELFQYDAFELSYKLVLIHSLN